ncbi:MAG: TMEM175 family protein [Planctomycetota bacterium]
MKSIRRVFMEQDHGDEKEFRWRGGDVSRIESISDAVFAFSLTLVVLSTQVPRSWEELRLLFYELPAFATCFALISWLWLIHYYYFRRFGLEDRITITLNGFLLFSVLAYVFPLKYLATGIISVQILGAKELGTSMPRDSGALMIFYSVGFTVIFLCFTLLYLHAWRQRDSFELNAPERSITRGALRAHAAMVLVGGVSLILTQVSQVWAGLVFFAIGPIQGILGWRNGVRVDREFREWKQSQPEVSGEPGPH